MIDVISEDPNVIYQFWIEVDGKTIEVAKQKILPVIKQCEYFSQSLDILFMADNTGIVDGTVKFRLQFNIRAPQVIVLEKVSALFAFAASHKLFFANQFFLSK